MKKLLAGLGITLLVAGFTATHLWRELRTQREHNRALVARVAVLESAPSPAPDARLAVAASPAPAPAGEAASSLPPSPPAGAGDLRSMVSGMLDTPEGQEFARTMMRMSLEQQYPDLAKALGLSPEQAERLLDLLVRQRTELGTQRASLQLGGATVQAARQEAAGQLAQKEQAFEAEIAEMLGDGYPKWKEYQRAANERQRENWTRQGLEQLRSAVGAGGNPLGEAQFQALNAALKAEQGRIDQEHRGQSLQQQAQRLAEDHRRLTDVAAAHLDPAQLDGYRRYLQQQAELMRAVSGAMGGAQGATVAQ